jgi:hypothetical protein
MVKKGGTLIMEAGAAIMDNHNDYSDNYADWFGGGVNLYNGGKFILKDGTISGNRALFGGGVHAWGTFIMEDGGKITYNIADSSGGGVCVNEGTFTMKGGTISNNSSSPSSDSDGIDGIEELSGQIRDPDNDLPLPVNLTFGEGAEDHLYDEDLEIEFKYILRGGGGVYVLGTFIMEGGTISGNKSEGEGYGGGVLILGKYWAGDIFSTFEKKTGGVIRNNAAALVDQGGEVYASASALANFMLKFTHNDYIPDSLHMERTSGATYTMKREEPAGLGVDLLYKVHSDLSVESKELTQIPD